MLDALVEQGQEVRFFDYKLPLIYGMCDWFEPLIDEFIHDATVHGIDGKGGFPVDISVYRLAVGSTVYEDVTYGTVAGPIQIKIPKVGVLGQIADQP